MRLLLLLLLFTYESPAVSTAARQHLEVQVLEERISTDIDAREVLIGLLASHIDVDTEDLAAEWQGGTGELAVVHALTQLGVPYRSLARQPERGFDCSGLTSWAWQQAGVEIPRSSGRQIRSSSKVEEPIPGDLVYYPGHVGMYVGQGWMIHAPTHGENVQLDPVPERAVYGRPEDDW